MKTTLRLGFIVVALCAITSCGNPLWWRSPDQIERSLLQATPLGSSEAKVLEWLRNREIEATVTQAPIEPHSDYPPSEVGGTAFIHESVAHYRFIFRTDVEAFYIFDSTHQLVDLQVRKTTDAL